MTTRAEMVEKVARLTLSAIGEDDWPPAYNESGDWVAPVDERFRQVWIDHATAILDAILPQVSTVAELAALPLGTSLMDEDGDCWELPHDRQGKASKPLSRGPSTRGLCAGPSKRSAMTLHEQHLADAIRAGETTLHALAEIKAAQTERNSHARNCVDFLLDDQPDHALMAAHAARGAENRIVALWEQMQAATGVGE